MKVIQSFLRFPPTRWNAARNTIIPDSLCVIVRPPGDDSNETLDRFVSFSEPVAQAATPHTYSTQDPRSSHLFFSPPIQTLCASLSLGQMAINHWAVAALGRRSQSGSSSLFFPTLEHPPCVLNPQNGRGRDVHQLIFRRLLYPHARPLVFLVRCSLSCCGRLKNMTYRLLSEHQFTPKRCPLSLAADTVAIPAFPVTCLDEHCQPFKLVATVPVPIGVGWGTQTFPQTLWFW